MNRVLDDRLERGLGKLGSYYFRSALRWDRESGSASNLDREEDFLMETRDNFRVFTACFMQGGEHG